MLLGKRSNINKEAQAQSSPVLLGLGLGFIGLSLALLAAIFYPSVVNEVRYRTNPPDSSSEVTIININGANQEEGKKYIVAADPFFSVVIPKIGANSKIIRDVDPLNSLEYQKKLTEGVAHAKGTALPGQQGNIFLFAHSSDNFINANRYNSVFYLINKLESKDKIYLIFNRKKYVYEVVDKKIVSAEEVSYLDPKSDLEKVTLMTCWPAGTTYKRLVVVAELVK